MSTWETVRCKKPWSKIRSKRRKDNEFATEDQVLTFLSTYKTVACQNHEPHDLRTCRFFHAHLEDRRRDPYAQYYEMEDCLTKTEKLYHPTIFRTTLCNRGEYCAFGSLCSHAHSEATLRDRGQANLAYETYPFQSRGTDPSSRVQLNSFVSAAEEIPNHKTREEVIDFLSQHRLPKETRILSLSKLQAFVLEHSKLLWKDLQTLACEEGLSVVEQLQNGTKLRLTGTDLDVVHARLMSILDEPEENPQVDSKYFCTRSLKVPDRIFSKLQEDYKRLLPQHSDAFHISFQVTSLTVFMLCVEQAGKKRAKDKIGEAMDKIQFWVEKEGYDKYTDCSFCMDRYNEDQGLCCDGCKNFCCDECFSAMVSSQLNTTTVQDVGVTCPMCQSPFPSRLVAKHCTSEVWDKLQKEIIDAKVAKEAEELNKQFDAMLDEKVRELLMTYNNGDVATKHEARKQAHKARDTILNLRCPHCAQAYYEFTGCMALTCQVCKGHFCGYCHKPCTSGQGNHEHVRECLMNETPNASYWADAATVRDAQRRYRTREIKKFIRNFKKPVQNAIVIELEQDLKDLGIKQEALFDFGYIDIDNDP